MSLLELIFIAIVQFHRKIYNIILAEFILSRDVRCYQKLAINVEILVKCFIKVWVIATRDFTSILLEILKNKFLFY